MVFLVVSFLLALQPLSYMHSSAIHSCYMSRPLCPLPHHHPNYTWVKSTNYKIHLVMQFPPSSRHIVHLRPKYPPQRPVLNALSTSIKTARLLYNHTQNYNFLYSDFYVSIQQARRQKVWIELQQALVELDRLCGLMVRVLGYRSGGPGSIPGTTRKN
jgi:hypothetical protein